MAMTKRELIQFMDELVELASEENKARAILVKEKFINDFEKSYEYEKEVQTEITELPPYYIAAMPDLIQEEIKVKVIVVLTECGECTPENVERAMSSKIYDLDDLIDIKEYVRRIKLARVSVFPQCYAAVADRMKTLPKRVVVVDIGSWTIDIMPIEDSAPNEAECITIREGLIKCMRTINEECMRQYGKDLSEEDIQEIMRTGKHEKLPQKYLTIVEECLRAYVDKVYNILLEHGYNLEVTEIVFVGGGANVVKRFGNYDGNNIQYIEDVKANAKGYEYLGKLYLATHKKEFGLG